MLGFLATGQENFVFLREGQGGEVIDGFQVRFLEAAEGKGNGKAHGMRHGGGIDTNKGEGKGKQHGKGKPTYKGKGKGWYGSKGNAKKGGKGKFIAFSGQKVDVTGNGYKTKHSSRANSSRTRTHHSCKEDVIAQGRGGIQFIPNKNQNLCKIKY